MRENHKLCGKTAQHCNNFIFNEQMEFNSLSSCEDFEDYCLRAFERFLQGDLFPYSLKETYHLAYPSYEEAVKNLLDDGPEGFAYQESPDGSDYWMCMQGFSQHILVHEQSLKLLSDFCNITYHLLVKTFDIPLRYETRSVMGDNGRMKIEHVPINGHQPKMTDPRYSGIMEANGDLVAKVRFDRFLMKAGFTESTAKIAEAFGMPEEGLLCILQQNGIIVLGDDDEEGSTTWELAENFRDKEFTQVKTGPNGKPETQWTYKGFFFIWLLLTKDCNVTPCCERT